MLDAFGKIVSIASAELAIVGVVLAAVSLWLQWRDAKTRHDEMNWTPARQARSWAPWMSPTDSEPQQPETDPRQGKQLVRTTVEVVEALRTTRLSSYRRWYQAQHETMRLALAVLAAAAISGVFALAL